MLGSDERGGARGVQHPPESDHPRHTAEGAEQSRPTCSPSAPHQVEQHHPPSPR